MRGLKKKIKLFIVYFPVILVASQVLGNSIYFISANTYYNIGVYLNTFLGTNVLFSLFLVCFTFMFKFCSISKWAAIVELSFGIFYLLIQKDDLYNIVYQMIAGSIAVFVTFATYIKKFPFCKMSLFASFMASVFYSKGDCEKAIDIYNEKLNEMSEPAHR